MEKGTYDTSEPATSTSGYRQGSTDCDIRGPTGRNFQNFGRWIPGYRTEYVDRVERCGNKRIDPVHGVFPPDKLVPGRSPSIKNGTGYFGPTFGQLPTEFYNSVMFKEDGIS